MQRGMDWLDGLVRRRRALVLGAWIVLLLASLPFSLRQTERLTSGGFDSPGSSSAAVDAALADFPGVERDRLAVLLAARPGGDAGRVRAEIRRIDRVAARLPHLELSERAEAAALRRAGAESVTLVPLAVTGSVNEVSDVTVDLREELGVGEGPRGGVEPYLVGQQALWAGMQQLAKEDLAAAEAVGFPIVLLVLLAVFGSLAAAALPLALGATSVMVTGGAIFFLSRATDMSVFVTNLASMIGIGVAVDYSLFVLARYREEVRAGRPPEEARRVAMRTSGLAVAFSGVTVIIALAGLFLVNSTTMRSMAMGAIVVVAVSVLGAATLLPALIGVLGHRARDRGRLDALLARGLRRLAGRRGDGRGGR
nr:MMPL family transporter [Actinomycetota bacterium]